MQVVRYLLRNTYLIFFHLNCFAILNLCFSNNFSIFEKVLEILFNNFAQTFYLLLQILSLFLKYGSHFFRIFLLTLKRNQGVNMLIFFKWSKRHGNLAFVTPTLKINYSRVSTGTGSSEKLKNRFEFNYFVYFYMKYVFFVKTSPSPNLFLND